MPNHHVHVQNLDDGLICIRIHRFISDRDLGGEFIIHSEAVAWLIDAIGKIVEDFQSREQRIWRR